MGINYSTASDGITPSKRLESSRAPSGSGKDANYYGITSIPGFTFGDGENGFLIVSGVHGDESTSVMSSFMILDTLRKLQKNNMVNKKIIVIPVCNISAWESSKRTSPHDNKNLNRSFPGSIEGTFTEVLAYDIWNLAMSCEYILDIHCADINTSPYILSMNSFEDVLKEKDDGSLSGHRGFTDMFTGMNIVQSEGVRGQLFVEAHFMGKKAVVAELGGKYGISVPFHAEFFHDIVINILYQNGFIDCLPEYYYNKESHIMKSANDADVGVGNLPQLPEYFEKLFEIKSSGTGFFVPSVKAGEYVEENHVLGNIHVYEHNPIIIVVYSTFNGRVIRVKPAFYAFSGDTLCHVAKRLNGKKPV